MVIRSVEMGSPAQRSGIREGESLVSINGNAIRDLLDYRFHVADGDLTLIVESVDRTPRTLRIDLDPGQDLGIEVDGFKTRLCGNACVFCFIDQLPKGMRKTLYVKDEDYRLSFLHGNFITLTNMKRWELERIVEQRLSPLYISVHSTTPETRRRLLQPKVDKDVLSLIDYLGQSGIEMHTQVVLCPGYNDGSDLDRTIRDLAARWPYVRSLAIVPLGMTEHRTGLVELAPMTPQAARVVLDQVKAHQERFRGEMGVNFVYLADEIYRMLGRKTPPASHYDGFPQLENGIGMTRHFLTRLRRARSVFGTYLARGERRFTLVTGEMFEPILRPELMVALERTGEAPDLTIVGCENRFFGRSVTVAGLLTGSDILRALEGRDIGDRVFIPPSTLNDDGVFLDDMTLQELIARCGAPIDTGLLNS